MKLFNIGLFNIKKKNEYAQVHLPRTIESTIFDAFIVLEVLAVWIISAWLYVRYETVPTHFNAVGQADAWGSHTMLIFMALMDTVVMGLLAYSAYRPKYVNTPVKAVTEEQLLLNARMIRITALIIGLLFILIAIKMGGAIFGLSDPAFAMLMMLLIVALMVVAIGFSVLIYFKRRK